MGDIKNVIVLNRIEQFDFFIYITTFNDRPKEKHNYDQKVQDIYVTEHKIFYIKCT